MLDSKVLGRERKGRKKKADRQACQSAAERVKKIGAARRTQKKMGQGKRKASVAKYNVIVEMGLAPTKELAAVEAAGSTTVKVLNQPLEPWQDDPWHV